MLDSFYDEWQTERECTTVAIRSPVSQRFPSGEQIPNQSHRIGGNISCLRIL